MNGVGAAMALHHPRPALPYFPQPPTPVRVGASHGLPQPTSMPQMHAFNPVHEVHHSWPDHGMQLYAQSDIDSESSRMWLPAACCSASRCAPREELIEEWCSRSEACMSESDSMDNCVSLGWNRAYAQTWDDDLDREDFVPHVVRLSPSPPPSERQLYEQHGQRRMDMAFHGYERGMRIAPDHEDLGEICFGTEWSSHKHRYLPSQPHIPASMPQEPPAGASRLNGLVQELTSLRHEQAIEDLLLNQIDHARDQLEATRSLRQERERELAWHARML